MPKLKPKRIYLIGSQVIQEEDPHGGAQEDSYRGEALRLWDMLQAVQGPNSEEKDWLKSYSDSLH